VSGRRALAHWLDWIAFSLLVVLPFYALLAVLDGLGVDLPSFVGLVFLVLFLPAQVAYFVFTQRKTGASPGKRLMNIRVIDAAGGLPSREALLRRSVPLIFEQLYLVALFAMLRSPDRQRFGDRWADTYVIEGEAGQIERRIDTADQRLSCASCGEAFESETAASAHVARFHTEEFPDPTDGINRSSAHG